jgi:Family of unknown function (DUF5372)
VTHPFHPLHGKTLTFIEARTAWGEDRVYFLDNNGERRRIPTAWTSVAAPSTFEAVSAGRAHFRIDDLLQLVALLSLQRKIDRPKKGSPVKRKVLSK